MNRDFKGIWIPREIWEMTDLNWTEKILLVEIDSLDVDGQGCYASNEYLAKFLGVSKERLRKLVYKLTEAGYLRSEITYKDGGNEVDKRYLWANMPGQKRPDPVVKNDQTPLGENDQTPWSETTTKKKRVRDVVEEKKGRETPSASQVVQAYHDKCPSLAKIVKVTDARRKAINARLGEYTMEQIQQAFEMAEASDFLKGKNDREWAATFDWLMKPGNLAKVLEGNYVNKKGRAETANTDRYQKIEEEETL